MQTSFRPILLLFSDFSSQKGLPISFHLRRGSNNMLQTGLSINSLSSSFASGVEQHASDSLGMNCQSNCHIIRCPTSIHRPIIAMGQITDSPFNKGYFSVIYLASATCNWTTFFIFYFIFKFYFQILFISKLVFAALASGPGHREDILFNRTAWLSSARQTHTA